TLIINNSIPEVRTQMIGSSCFMCSRSHICLGRKKHAMTKNMFTTAPSKIVRPNHAAHTFLWREVASFETSGASINLSLVLLKSFHILHQRVFLLRRQINAVKVTSVGVTRNSRIKQKVLMPFLFGNIRVKADILLIVHIVSSIEFCGSSFYRFKQISKCRH